jgi:hypothetical protein
MKVLVAFDGSDDGFDGLRMAAGMLSGLGTDHKIALVIVGWPPRHAPIWDRALERNFLVNDLHRAMAEVAAAEFVRLRALFEPLGSILPEYAEGDVVAEVVELAALLEPDLVIAGITRGRNATHANAAALAIVHRIPTPVFIAFGSGDEL